MQDPTSSIEASHEYSSDDSTDHFSDAASGDDASMYSLDEFSDGESVEGIEIGSDERRSTENECLNEEYLIHPNLSVKEGSLLVFAFILRHRLTNEGVQHLLDLIRLFCPGSKFPGSKFLLHRQLNIKYDSITNHYYCESCKQMLKQENQICPKCSAPNTDKFFITFDVQKSMEIILQQEDVSSNLLQNLKSRNESANSDLSYYEDIFHGQKYRDLTLQPYDFTVTMNNDGVPCFRSSNFSVSPFLLSINELSYPLRRKHTFIAALKEKPSMCAFLPPIVRMLNKFTTE
ncbi:unnamed protein product, partial [Allacma fusca]